MAKRSPTKSESALIEASERYCREHDLGLSSANFRDLGVPPFQRNAVEDGALAAFIGAVEAGKITKGSYLIIEQFDRLTREEASSALALLSHLVTGCEVAVVTLADMKVWDRSIINDSAELLLSIAFMSRSSSDSAARSERLRSAWTKKKQIAAVGTSASRRIVTSECPRWLKPNKEKTGFEILDQRVESIKKIFALRIEGFGIDAITRRANQERWPVPGNSPVLRSGEDPESFERRKMQDMTWHASNVSRLLKNRALLGEYQPHVNDPGGTSRRIPVGDPIANYYPAVLDTALFEEVRTMAGQAVRYSTNRVANPRNWLQGMVRCSCGQSFVRKNKGSGTQPGYAQYCCSAQSRRVTKCLTVNAVELEAAVLAVVSGASPQHFGGTSKLQQLEAQKDSLIAGIVTVRQARDRYVEAIGLSDVPVAALLNQLEICERALASNELQLAQLNSEIACLDDNQTVGIMEIVKAVRESASSDAIRSLRVELSRAIDKIVVHQQDRFIEVFFRDIELPVRQPMVSDHLSVTEDR